MPLIPEIEPAAVGKPELELKTFSKPQAREMSGLFNQLNAALATHYKAWYNEHGEVEASQMCMSVLGKLIAHVAEVSTEPENVFRSIIARGWEDYRMWELRVKSARAPEVK